MGFVPSQSKVSDTSLNIVAQFFEYESWEDFKHNQEKCKPSKKIITDYHGLKLFDIACKNHHFKTVLDYLKILPTDDYSLYRHFIGEIIGNTIRRDLKAREVLLPELAKTPQGRFYFYENFVDIDFLSHYYSDSLDYYKKHINRQDKKRALRDDVFALSIQFLNQLQLQNKVGAVKVGYALNKLTKKRILNIDNIGHILPFIRYKANIITYWYLSNQTSKSEINSWLEELVNIIETANPFIKTFTLSEVFKALAIGKRYSDIRFLFSKYVIDKPLSNQVPGHLNLILVLAKKSYEIIGDDFLYNNERIIDSKYKAKDFSLP